MTDHSASHGFGNHVTPEALEARIDEIAALNERLDGFTVLAGTESNILPDGSLDYPDELLERLDWVIGSIHTSFGMDEEAMTERMLKAIEHPWLDAIGHPTGRKIETRPPYSIDMSRVIAAAAANGTMIEINSAPDRRDMNEIHARAAAEAGVMVLIDSDAHGAETLTNVRFGIATARRAWLSAGAGGQHALVGGLRAAAQAGARVKVLDGRLSVCRLPASERVPSWALELHEGFVSITRTPDELSIVCPEEAVPPDTTVEEGFRALVLPGPIPFTETGVLASLAVPLAAAGISIFADRRPSTPTTCWSARPTSSGAGGARRAGRQRVSSGSPFEPVIGFSRAVRVGDRVLVSGTGPVMPDGGCPSSTYEQARRCWEIVLAALAEAGAVGERRRAHAHVPHAGGRSRRRDAGPRRGVRRRAPGLDDAQRPLAARRALDASRSKPRRHGWRRA